jgi:hypothetical protein
MELRAACEAGRVTCSSNPTGTLVYSPLTPADLPEVGRLLVAKSVQFLTMDHLGEDLARFANRASPPEVVAEYRAITHARMIEGGASLDLPVAQHLGTYRAIHLIGAACLVFVGYRALRNRLTHRPLRRFSDTMPVMVITLALVFIASRLGLFAVIDALSWPSHLRYLMVSYPLMMLLFASMLALRPAGTRNKSALRN